MTEKPMTVAEVANFLRRSIKSVKRLPIPFSRVGKGRLYCCVLLAMPVGNRLLRLTTVAKNGIGHAVDFTQSF